MWQLLLQLNLLEQMATFHAENYQALSYSVVLRLMIARLPTSVIYI